MEPKDGGGETLAETEAVNLLVSFSLALISRLRPLSNVKVFELKLCNWSPRVDPTLSFFYPA